ncbi:MAG: tetratricopeptide repeat protein [Candidatus Omnitrophica bacterium]|nr:tetratricopeptide repeat protein [Candidatus Omnitrophota bacterium]
MRSILFAVYLVLFGAVLAGCQSADYLAEKAFHRANKVLAHIHHIYERSDTKDPSILEPAVDAFQNIVEKYPSSPKSPESLFVISQIRRQQGNMEAARGTLKKVIQNYTGVGSWAEDARYRIGQLHEEEDHWAEAEQAYWEVVDYHPLKPKGLYAPIYILNHYKSKKDTAGEQKAYQKAVDHFQKLIKETGPIELSVGAKYFLGIIHASAAHWQEAREVWIQAANEIKESPYSPLCLLAAAEVSWRNGEKEKASELYDLFYANYSNHGLATRVSVRRAQLYHDMSQYAKEREWLAKALEQYFSGNTDAQADIQFMIGKSYQDEGLWTEADKIYREIELNYPNSGAALQVPLMTAVYQETHGQAEEAKRLIDEAINRYERLGEDQPESPAAEQARRLVNEAYAMKGDWQEVLANVDEDMEKETVTTRKGSWLFLKALIAENRLGDKQQAQSLFESFLKEYPQHPLVKLARTRLDGLTTSTT